MFRKEEEKKRKNDIADQEKKNAELAALIKGLAEVYRDNLVAQGVQIPPDFRILPAE